MLKNITLLLCIIVSMAVGLVGCGGSSTNPFIYSGTSSTLSGTAAAGAPIIGNVTIKDSSSPAKTKTVKISADGKYTIDVSGLKAPYMVRADGYVGGQEYHLYSAATSADVNGTINITPLTDLIVANIAGSIASTYFENGSFSGLTAAQLTEETTALKEKLLPVLQALGVSDSIDLLRASFSTDHTGLDAALDILRVETAAGVATITNIITKQQITSTLSTGTFSGTMTDTAGVVAAVTDIQAIDAGFNVFSALFASGLPSESNATLLSLFDSNNFKESGRDLATWLSEMTTSSSNIGIKLSNIAILEKTDTTALVMFDVIQYDKVVPFGPKPWYFVKSNGKWLSQGNQRIAEVNMNGAAEYYTGASPIYSDEIRTGLGFEISDPGAIGIAYAIVTGAGLPGQGVRLESSISSDSFMIPNIEYGNRSLYKMTDEQINLIADSGEIYTVKLYDGADQLLVTYTEKLRKKPYLNTALTSANFANVTSPTLDQLKAFNGGNITVNWTLPSGLDSDFVDIILENFGNAEYKSSEAELAPTDRSKTLIVDTLAAASRWIFIGATDSYGRSMETAFWNFLPPQL